MVTVSKRVTRLSLQESSATLSANTSSRCPSGERLSSTPSLCSSQSSLFSTPGTTGAGERMPWRVAFQRTISLPPSVLGPPLRAVLASADRAPAPGALLPHGALHGSAGTGPAPGCYDAREATER